jgi:hypothetical protein
MTIDQFCKKHGLTRRQRDEALQLILMFRLRTMAMVLFAQQ